MQWCALTIFVCYRGLSYKVIILNYDDLYGYMLLKWFCETRIGSFMDFLIMEAELELLIALEKVSF